jgi:hypothetical protein
VNMSTLPNLLRSLLLTSIFTFLAPVLLICILLAGSAVISYVPHLEAFGSGSLEQIANFLKVFGSGSVWRGITVIGLVGSLVGILFDTYTFYRFQNLRDHQ